MSLAKKIVQLRKERNLTQKELAKIVGVHFSHMSRYEREISLPSVDVVKKIAQMFNISADYLLFDDNDAMIRANIADQELLQQFERISHMGEREKTAVKTILDGVILKYDLEAMLGVKHPSAAAAEENTTDRCLSELTHTRTKATLLQHLNGTLG